MSLSFEFTADHDTALARASAANAQLATAVNPRWYPRFHIAAPAGWINDPNGLIQTGEELHVFFQHHPYSTEWGPMHWGHVVSRDGATWERRPLALAPSLEADRDGVFSGSALQAPCGHLEVFYTGNRYLNSETATGEDCSNETDSTNEAIARCGQTQCRAISRDGVTFEKKGVVVPTPEGVRDFRDPKVWRHGDMYRMVVGVQSADCRGEVWMYTSPDLARWSFECVLYRHPDPRVFMLECPDFFPLGDTWVLIFSPMGIRPEGFAHCNVNSAGYLLGSWTPGGRFEPRVPYRTLNWGHSFYAPQTCVIDGQRTLFGWMGSFGRAPASTADGWSGQLTVPMSVHLESGDLCLRPATALARLRGQCLWNDDAALAASAPLTLARNVTAADISVSMLTGECERLRLRIGSDTSSVSIIVDRNSGTIGVDRSAAVENLGYRAAPWAPAYCLWGERTGVIAGETVPKKVGDSALAPLTFRVLVDASSVEVIAGNGERVLSSLAFVEGIRDITLLAEEGDITVAASVWEMTDAFPQAEPEPEAMNTKDSEQLGAGRLSGQPRALR
ncbi:glycoside hydrolase family 32 protein [Actinotignum timonense]|uniref:glycoside hydrolase family 32 protein n=1 Tax=Actinotignum TaxID=1653174 RepID=UPI000F7DBAFD|nr:MULTISPECIES: GH32 C-terminal domain-containing protein [Actinotignum]MDK6907254.1 GH32 C-terminal domain-containing protein [Actinotignum timonense]MDK8781962.1 GH32 C-terminal domain-containing protein [Actinotignum timonense]MDY5148730.1 GH32 C-terminal domain-containing protein [Actinotignum sanguinis]RTE49379.1 beta-(1-2)-fructofuranosidase [Actinotignum sanguinis]